MVLLICHFGQRGDLILITKNQEAWPGNETIQLEFPSGLINQSIDQMILEDYATISIYLKYTSSVWIYYYVGVNL